MSKKKRIKVDEMRVGKLYMLAKFNKYRLPNYNKFFLRESDSFDVKDNLYALELNTPFVFLGIVRNCHYPLLDLWADRIKFLCIDGVVRYAVARHFADNLTAAGISIILAKQED